ncbi:cell envelope biogenesis protein TolA [Thalassococcus sp. BH17M4-6]|uniref:cell envelope biogenesis protein TolA n=1 Tax=Thalassococcus sp. BH17M4-6 TaxID=3413148 RepID=UPI003BCA6CED
MHIGHYISGAGHGVLILWLLFGGIFEPEPEAPQVAEVSVLSEAEFAALTAQSQPPESTVDVAAPPAPEVTPEPVPEPPAPEPAPAPQPEPEAAEPPAPEAAPEAPAPPPQADISDAAPVLDAPEPEPLDIPETAPRPQPRPAPRVAPEPVAPPEPDTAVAEVEQEAVVPDETAPADTPPEPEQEATAPEAAATEIVTEAEEPASAAPTASVRPRTRPNRPAPAPEPSPEPSQTAETAEPAPATDTADAVADAVAQALAGGTTDPALELPVGPPMTSSEKDALRVAVQRCWVVDVGSQAANVTVTVAMEMDQSGKVVGAIRLASSDGGPQSAVDTAFQAARRAILRCQRDGYDLPSEKYAQWREIEMTFNPDGMRVR